MPSTTSASCTRSAKIGQGVPRDYAEAFRWYQKAADQGHAGGQYYVGLMYQLGRGVAQNDAEAVTWYRKAAAASNRRWRRERRKRSAAGLGRLRAMRTQVAYTHYTGRTASAGYHRAGKSIIDGRGIYCLSVGAVQIDEAVAHAVLAALAPRGVEAALAAAERIEADHRSRQRAGAVLAIERTSCEAQRAERR